MGLKLVRTCSAGAYKKDAAPCKSTEPASVACLVPLRGLTPPDVTSLPDSKLRLPPAERGAKCDSVSVETGVDCPTTAQVASSPLAAIAQAIASLSADDRARLAAMLAQDGGEKGGSR